MLEACQFFQHSYYYHFNLHGTCHRIPKSVNLLHRCSSCDRSHTTLQWTNVSRWGVLSLVLCLSPFHLHYRTFSLVGLAFLVSHIADDFIFIAPVGSANNNLIGFFLEIARYAGIPIKASNTITPRCVALVHGIEVDTRTLEVRLPVEKISALVDLLEHCKDKRSVRLRTWQSLIGHLNFATRVVRPGLPFISKLIDRIRGVLNPLHYIKLNSDIQKDIAVWLASVQHFNGVSLISPTQGHFFCQKSVSHRCIGVGVVLRYYVTSGFRSNSQRYGNMHIFPQRSLYQ